jgi:hypothetical protein
MRVRQLSSLKRGLRLFDRLRGDARPLVRQLSSLKRGLRLRYRHPRTSRPPCPTAILVEERIETGLTTPLTLPCPNGGCPTAILVEERIETVPVHMNLGIVFLVRQLSSLKRGLRRPVSRASHAPMQCPTAILVEERIETFLSG